MRRTCNMRHAFLLVAVLPASLMNSACQPTSESVTSHRPDGGSREAGPETGAPDAGCAQAGTWDAQPVRVDTNGTQGGDGVHVGFDGAGNAIAVWEQAATQGGVPSVWASLRGATGAWSPPVQISTTPVVGGSATGTA